MSMSKFDRSWLYWVVLPHYYSHICRIFSISLTTFGILLLVLSDQITFYIDKVYIYNVLQEQQQVTFLKHR